jgi:hypothetical protein
MKIHLAQNDIAEDAFSVFDYRRRALVAGAFDSENLH